MNCQLHAVYLNCKNVHITWMILYECDKGVAFIQGNTTDERVTK
jgi:hypothetical protein